MERDLDDCEFWLPPQFLTDDDLLVDFKQSGNEANKLSGLGGFGFNSGITSPVESVVCSTETESDEDDYITGLTSKMAHSTLDELSHHHYEASKAWGVSGSPKSPLCSGLVGYGSSRGSPRRAQTVSSTHALRQNEAAWNLLCAAAGEVSRMKMVEESTAGFYPCRERLVDPTRKPNPISVPLENSRTSLGFSSNQPRLSYQQLQAAWFEQLKRQQLMKHQQQQGNGIWGQGKGGCGQHLYPSHLNQQMAQSRVRDVVGERPVGLPMSSWPTLQQSQQPQAQPQPGSGMRAVFLGNPGAKRECAGTGVFLPRRIGTPTETRYNKSAACSTVLVPDRVVQALNLNLDAMDTQPQVHYKHNPSFTPDYDAALKYNKNLSRAYQRQNSVRPQPVVNHQEPRLPQEWTY